MGALALFISLGGVGYAATGGTFILGQANTATTPSSLSAPVAGKTLQLTNTSTGTGATALGLTVASGKAPFSVNSTGKVTNLNGDKLDGLDSTSFLRTTGKAADANTLDGIDSTGFYAAGDKVADSFHADSTESAFNSGQLDGIDSTGFVQGGGHVYQNRFHATAYVNYGLLDVPGFGTLYGGCDPSGRSFVDFYNSTASTIDAMVDDGAGDPVYQALPSGSNNYNGNPGTKTNERMIMQLGLGTNMATLIIISHAVSASPDCWISAVATTNN